MTAVIDCGIMANSREQPPICYAHIRLLKTNFEPGPKNGGRTVKDGILKKYNVPIIRFSTVGSGEKDKLINALAAMN